MATTLRRSLGLILVATACTSLVGCGPSGPVTTSVHGNVNLDGAPIPTGEIQFFPTDSEDGPSSGPITDGTYSFESTLGPKRVVILGYTPTGPVFDGVPGNVQVVPTQYNEQTTLTAEVTDGGEPIDFDLQGAKK